VREHGAGGNDIIVTNPATARAVARFPGIQVLDGTAV